MGPTVGEALAGFRQANGLADDEAARSSWTCRVGPIRIRFPNFKWRRKAILAHDLHHVLTGIPCGLRGEFQMAAWEFGAGPMPHWGAALFCLPLVLLGLLWSPRRIVRAYRAGRRSRSLHQSKAIDRLLATPLQEARANMASVRNAPEAGT
jgi:ubiquinone biosynthesis protein Coq4